MDSLTARAERALLGAMIAEPRLARQLGYLRPADFNDQWHQAVYSAILAASRDHPPVPDGWRDAIARASGPAAVTTQELDDLVGDCPDPRHGPAYGTMVVQAGALQILKDQARELAARARQLASAARYPAHGLSAQGAEAGIAAGHLGKVAAAIREHADYLGPRTVHAAVPGGPSLDVAQAQREELVLAALLKPGRTWAWAMAAGVPAEAFLHPLRHAVFGVLTAMHRDRRPVDPLTADWELASSGLPVYQGTGTGADGLSEETYTTRLARMEVARDQAIKAARELQRDQRRATGPQAAPDKRPPGAGSQRRGRGTAGQPSSRSAEQPWPRPQVAPRPPGRSTEGPGRGPQQRR